MEIKVTETVKHVENAGLKTYLFEGRAIVHEFIDFRDVEHFRSIINSRTVHTHVMEMGIPVMWWNGDYNEKTEGAFLLITYADDHSGEVRYLVIKNCDIYITNNGKTIDKIYVH